MNNAQSTSQKVVAWARPVYARPVNAPEPAGEWDEVVDIEFHNRPEKPEGEGWYPLVVADTGRQSTHSDDCWSWGHGHYECAVRKIRELRAEVERLKPMTAMTMGVGSGDGNLFVHGDYESIKAAQAIVLERGALRAEVERDEALLQQALHALEYASDMTKPDDLQGCDCTICISIAALRERLNKKEKV